MNKRMFAVAKKNFKEKFIGFFPNTRMPGMPKNHILRIIVLLISYLLMGVLSFFISELLATILVEKMHLDESYFTYSGILITIALLIYSSFEIISDFYESKETEIMLSFPLKEDDIFLGKLIGNIASDVDYFIFLAIIFTVYFTKVGFSLIKVFIGIVSFVSLIVIAYSILCLLIMVIMRFTNVRKYKLLFKFIGYGLGLGVFGLYYYFIFSSKDFDFAEKDIDKLIQSFSNLREGIENFFYPSKLFGQAIGNEDYMSFAILIGLGILSFLLVKFVASKIYFDSIIEKQSEKTKKKRKTTKKTDLKASSQTMALAKKEFISVIKNPVYLYQSGILVVMVTAILIANGKNINISEIEKELSGQGIRDFQSLFLGIGLIMSSFLFSNNVSAFTSLSREGKSFYLIQTLPIDPNSNVLGRFLGLYLINFIVSVLLSLVAFIFIGLSMAQALLLFIGMIFGGIFSVFYGLFWGTKKIYTTWAKPSELSRTGFIGFIMFIVSLVINAVIYGLAFGIYWISESFILAILMVMLGLIIASVLFYLFTTERYKIGFFDVK
ncbi:MAG: ABC transporter permease [Anaerococcus sp.]